MKVQLFDVRGDPAGTHDTLGAPPGARQRVPVDDKLPYALCIGDRIYRRVGETRLYQAL